MTLVYGKKNLCLKRTFDQEELQKYHTVVPLQPLIYHEPLTKSFTYFAKGQYYQPDLMEMM